MAKYKHVLSSDVAFHEGRLVWAPDWLSKLFVFSKAEKAQDQRYILYSEAVQKGWDVVVEGDDKDPFRDRTIKAAAAIVKGNKTEMLNQVFDEVAACRDLGGEIESESLCNNST